jgi:hypothetical protein
MLCASGLKRDGGAKDRATFRVTWTADGHRHWFSPQVSGRDGKFWLLGNPIYIDWSAPPA